MFAEISVFVEESWDWNWTLWWFWKVRISHFDVSRFIVLESLVTIEVCVLTPVSPPGHRDEKSCFAFSCVLLIAQYFSEWNIKEFFLSAFDKGFDKEVFLKQPSNVLAEFSAGFETERSWILGEWKNTISNTHRGVEPRRLLTHTLHIQKWWVLGTDKWTCL